MCRPLLFFRLFWLVLLCADPLYARVWKELDGVVYVEDEANDADSFHAKRNSSKYLFRLYFVDAPETDLRYPDRVKEQAEYFGVSVEQAVKGAREAAVWVEKQLKDKKLTVYTRYTDARGASKQKRYFAMVKVGDRWLSEMLVEQGYARIYGLGTDLPDDTDQKTYWARLRKLEKEAKENHRGLWGVASGKLDIAQLKAGRKIKLPAATTVFHVRPPHQAVGTLPADWEVTLGPATRPGFRQIQFTSPGGADFTGEIQERALQ